ISRTRGLPPRATKCTGHGATDGDGDAIQSDREPPLLAALVLPPPGESSFRGVFYGGEFVIIARGVRRRRRDRSRRRSCAAPARTNRRGIAQSRRPAGVEAAARPAQMARARSAA